MSLHPTQLRHQTPRVLAHLWEVFPWPCWLLGALICSPWPDHCEWVFSLPWRDDSLYLATLYGDSSCPTQTPSIQSLPSQVYTRGPSCPSGSLSKTFGACNPDYPCHPDTIVLPCLSPFLHVSEQIPTHSVAFP